MLDPRVPSIQLVLPTLHAVGCVESVSTEDLLRATSRMWVQFLLFSSLVIEINRVFRRTYAELSLEWDFSLGCFLSLLKLHIRPQNSLSSFKKAPDSVVNLTSQVMISVSEYRKWSVSPINTTNVSGASGRRSISTIRCWDCCTILSNPWVEMGFRPHSTNYFKRNQ